MTTEPFNVSKSHTPGPDPNARRADRRCWLRVALLFVQQITVADVDVSQVGKQDERTATS